MNNINDLFKKIFICIAFLFCCADVVVSQIPIWDVAGFNDIANNPSGAYELMQDIGPVTSPIAVPFTGTLQGNGFKITVDINSNATNVGLFSVLDDATIDSLIIDGQVTGGSNSQNVGGFVGLIIDGFIFGCTNLADVTGLSNASSVGGIAGSSNDVAFHQCSNNGTITGGYAVAGIIGYSNANLKINIIRCKNAGIIQGIGESQYCMAGIIAYCEAAYMRIQHAVNIGRILSSNSQYAGGLAAYLTGGLLPDIRIHESCNSGIVGGSTFIVGGIVGYTFGNFISGCLNTNWVDSGTAIYYGSVIGYNNTISIVDRCYFDIQMSIHEGVGGGYAGFVEGRPTEELIGYRLQNQIVGAWIYRDGLYPICATNNIIHPIELLAIAPIYLPYNERENDVRNNFYVSNYGSTPPPFMMIPPPPKQILYPYLWGWHNPTFKAFSFMNYITISLPFANNAIINGSGNGQDSIAVRLTTDPIFEKIIPINVR